MCSFVQMCWWGPSWDCSLPACVIDSTTLHLRTLILTDHCVTERLFQQHKSANSPASTTFYPSKELNSLSFICACIKILIIIYSTTLRFVNLSLFILNMIIETCKNVI